MARKQIAALAALLCATTPGFALDPQQAGTTTMFYVSIPLDGRTPKEQKPVYGLALQGRQENQFFAVDTRMLNLLETVAGIEAKWIIAGAVATGAGVAIARKNKSTSQQMDQQKQ